MAKRKEKVKKMADAIPDRLTEKKEDRRLLPNVPDATQTRSNTDRREIRGEQGRENFSDFIDRQKGGVRYHVSRPVKIYVNKKKLQGFSEDLSGSGMRLYVQSKADYELISSVDDLRLSFEIKPGDMPEGYEMSVDIKARVVRHYEEDGRYYFGLEFAPNLLHYAKQRKDRYMFTASAIMLALISFCIVLMRAESVIYFRFHELLYFYSIIAAVFLLSRYLFGALYRPVDVDLSFTPGVSVIIPCFNEETWIQQTILGCINQDYPIDKLEVIVVDDCSTDGSVEKIREIIQKLIDQEDERYHIRERVSYYVQPRNAGKREALVRGVLEAKHELVVFVDSDSFLDPYAIRNLVQPFRDPKMGGVSGRTDVANTYTNGLTRMQSVRYYIAFRIMKAAESLFDCVTCLSGPLSCYRRDIVMEHTDQWLNQSFLGVKATFGDDRAMTNFVLRKYRTAYQDTAVCSTIVPNQYSVFLKQQMRWKRSWLRESLTAATFVWRKEPFAAFCFYIGLIVPILAPFVIIFNLIYIPIVHNVFPTTFLVGLLLMGLMMCAAQMMLRKSSTWLHALWFCAFYEAVLVWQMPIAILTFWKSTWGTRMTQSDVEASEHKRSRGSGLSERRKEQEKEQSESVHVH